jgi:hypothetical protein
MYHKEIVERVKLLRQQDLTYDEIRTELNIDIPKSTMATWCKGIRLSENYYLRIEQLCKDRLVLARALALQKHKAQRTAYLQSLLDKNKYLRPLIEDPNTAKIALAMLYLGEGAKSLGRAALMFANSDPLAIKLFLKLLQKCYEIDMSKIRGVVQCRADQNIGHLEEFWYNITAIPKNQWYKTRIDPRSIGKISRKPDYKGVCRLEYFSAHVFLDLMKTVEVLTGP